MEVFTATFEGVYPVGAAAVVVGVDESDARTQLENELVDRKLNPASIKLERLDDSHRGVTILLDGDY